MEGQAAQNLLQDPWRDLGRSARGPDLFHQGNLPFLCQLRLVDKAFSRQPSAVSRQLKETIGTRGQQSNLPKK
jgi:hypothetical protein